MSNKFEMKKNVLFSILIPSIPSRLNKFSALYSNLYNQKKQKPQIEIEILSDNTKSFLDGGISIGEKRDKLVQQARGKYLAFLDDDDEPMPNYIEVLSEELLTGLDCYTFNSLCVAEEFTSVVEMSHDNDTNEQLNGFGGITKRTYWHICPIKSRIAKTERFKYINNGEDWDWIQRIIPKIKTHKHLDIVLHQYNEQGSESKNITNKGFK